MEAQGKTFNSCFTSFILGSFAVLPWALVGEGLTLEGRGSGESWPAAVRAEAGRDLMFSSGIHFRGEESRDELFV